MASRAAQAVYLRTSALAVYEAVLGVARIRNTNIAVAEEVVDDFLGAMRVEIIPISAEIGRGAIRAF